MSGHENEGRPLGTGRASHLPLRQQREKVKRQNRSEVQSGSLSSLPPCPRTRDSTVQEIREALGAGRVWRGHNKASAHSQAVKSDGFATLWTVAARLLWPWDSPGKNTGVIFRSYHALLQGIFPTQGSNPSLLNLLHCRQIRYC